MDVPPVQYCQTSDGVSIAYWTLGEGGTPLILTAPTSNSHIGLECKIPDLAAFYQELSRNRMIVRYDPRGTGLSQRDLTDEQIEHIWLGRDMGAVIDDLGLERASLLGSAVPGASAVYLAAERPDLVDRLILISMGNGSDFDRFPQLKSLLEIAKHDWRLFTETWVRIFEGWDNENAGKAAEFIRRSISQDVFVRAVPHVYKISLAECLPSITARTLVMNDARGRAGGNDTATLLASGIKGARFVTHRGSRYYAVPEAVESIESFLAEAPDRPTATPIPSGTAVILFADIVDSTVLTEQLGDAAFRAKARDLDTAMRAAIRAANGTPVEGKLLGDGVLAVFTSAAQAITAATACRDAGADIGLPLHLGIHAGDVIREDDNVFGGAVNIAARISAASAPGELLVSDTVRSLARTSAGVSFEDRGEQALKGIEEPTRVFAVRQA